MDKESGFDKEKFNPLFNMKPLAKEKGSTSNCYQLRIHGKLHFVKEIKKEFKFNERMRAAFRKENEIGYSLSHAHLPRYVFVEGLLSVEEYVVTEWIEGKTLDEFIKSNKDYFKHKSNLLRFIREISETLDYLHDNGVFHGDLKPSNIMLTNIENHVKILDLGFARTDSHTMTGGFTPLYVAPEILSGNKPNRASDYYSLGKILEFIEKETGEKLYYKVRRLQNDLVSGEISKRPVGSSSINRYIDTGKTIIPVVAFLSLLVLIGIFFWVGREDRHSDKIEKENLTEKLGDLKRISSKEEPEPENVTNSQETVEESVSSSSNIMDEDKNLIQKENYNEKALEKEVDRMINQYYVPVLLAIDSLYKQEDFSTESMEKISRRHLAATLATFDSKHYMNLFPEIPGERLVFLVNSRIGDYTESVYTPIYMKYVQDVIDNHKTPSAE